MTPGIAPPDKAEKVGTDQVIIKPKANRKLDSLHVRAKGRLKKKLRRAGGDIDVIKLPTGVSVVEALAEYRASADVEYAEPDYLLHASATPNDPAYTDGTLWPLHNTGQNGGVNDADIDAPEGWAVRSQAESVVVAVVDTGVRFTHEDLASNMWVNPKEVPNNGRDDDANGYIDDQYGINALNSTGNPIDDNGHGTHVAGTIAAVGNNGRGAVGVAWRARIMALKFLDANGDGYTSDAVEAIDYARVNGAAIVNASFAGPGNSITLRDAVMRARAAGVAVVAAAGNETANNDTLPSYPANYAIDNVLSVAATTRGDTLANFSNYGAQTVHLAAPGSTIYSTFHTADNAYGIMSGTSMAAPHVAGAVALLRAHTPSHNYRQVIEGLLSSADRLPGLAGKTVTGARLNLQRALQGTSTIPASGPVTLSVLPGAQSGQLRLRVNGKPNQTVGIELSFDLRLWSPLTAVTLPGSGTIDIPLETTANPRGFYRARVF